MARSSAGPSPRETRALELGRRALTLRRAGQPGEAAALLRQAVALAPRHAGLLGNLGNALLASGAQQEALRVLARAAALEPHSGALAYNLGTAELAAGALDSARASLERALALGGVEAATRVNLGRLAEIEGRREAAAEQWQQAAELAPGLARPHYLLARIGRLADRRPLERLAAASDTSPEARVEACFGLGYALERAGDCAQAFAWFERGNALQRARLPAFDADAHEAELARLARVHDAELFRAHPGAHPSEAPLLLVGLPRSGTTLAESILAAHPAVAARGERRELELLARALRLRAEPERAASLTLAQRHAAAERYLTALALPPGALRATDKLPGNYVHLGLAALLIAGARVVHCRRDPLDTALSLFTTLFEGEALAYSYDLATIARVLRAERRLMAHWRAHLPLPIHALDYEALVADVEAGSRALVSFADLPWDPVCLARPAAGAVFTASAWRVREPVDARSVGRWRRFARELEPLRALLADA